MCLTKREREIPAEKKKTQKPEDTIQSSISRATQIETTQINVKSTRISVTYQRLMLFMLSSYGNLSLVREKDWGRREAGHKAFLIPSVPLTQHDLNQLSQVGRPPPANVHRIYTGTWVTKGEGL